MGNAYVDFEKQHGPGFEILFDSFYLWPDGAYCEASAFGFTANANDSHEKRNLEARRRYWTKRRELAAIAFKELKELATKAKRQATIGKGSVEGELTMYLRLQAEADAVFRTHRPRNVGPALRSKVEKPLWDNASKVPNCRVELRKPASEITLALLQGLRDEVTAADKALHRLDEQLNPPQPVEVQERTTQAHERSLEQAEAFGEAMEAIPDV